VQSLGNRASNTKYPPIDPTLAAVHLNDKDEKCIPTVGEPDVGALGAVLSTAFSKIGNIIAIQFSTRTFWDV
jgi:hypothetical protein